MKQKGDRIVGVKSIASYLNVSERTVFRWEQASGLPLYRIDGSKGHTVYAFRGELDKFIASDNKNSRSKSIGINRFKPILMIFLLVSIGFVFLLLIILNGGLFKLNSNEVSHGLPSFATINGNTVEIRDEDNAFLWSFTCESPWFDPTDSRHLTFQDVDSDGINEVFGVEYVQVRNRHLFTLYDSSGEILWQRIPTIDQTYDGIVFEGDYYISYFQIIKNASKKLRAIVVWRHSRRFLSVIIGYDMQGNEVNKYFHTGAVDSFRFLETFGKYKNIMIFFGMNNLLNGEGCVFALQADDFHGVAPPYSIEPEFNHLTKELAGYIPDTPELGNQLFYIRFSRPDLFREHQLTFLGSGLLDITSKMMSIDAQIWKVDMNGKESLFGFIVYIDQDLRIRSLDLHSVAKENLLQIAGQLNPEVSMEAIDSSCSQLSSRWRDGAWERLEFAGAR